MDPFAAIIFGGIAVILVALVLLGHYYPGTGVEQIDWRPTRSPELEAQNEIDDLEQMLEAANRRRRSRGEPELTEQTLRERVAADNAKRREIRDRYIDDPAEDVRQMLALKNARRRRKGLPEIGEDEYRAGLGQS